MRLLSRAKSLCASAILTTPLFLCSNLFSQVDTGSILGTVRDVSGGVVPRAVISLTSESTGLTLNTTTNVDGNYQFPGLRIGDYTVSAEATGFGKVTHEHLSLSIQQRLVADRISRQKTSTAVFGNSKSIERRRQYQLCGYSFCRSAVMGC